LPGFFLRGTPASVDHRTDAVEADNSRLTCLRSTGEAYGEFSTMRIAAP